MAAFDLCARRVYRFVDAANSPSCSSFLSLFPLPLGVSFSLSFWPLRIWPSFYADLLYITVEKSAFQSDSVAIRKKERQRLFASAIGRNESTMLVS